MREPFKPMFRAEHLPESPMQNQSERPRNHSAPAPIISVYNEKGGAGKTTLSCNLAHTLGRRGYRVLLVDLDRQSAAQLWATTKRREDAALFAATVWAGGAYEAKALVAELTKFQDMFDVIITDCAPSVENAQTWASLLMSNLALIPTKLNTIDMDALAQAKMLARKAIKLNGHPTATRVVPVGARMHINDDKFIIEKLRGDGDFPLTRTVLGFRQAYPRSRIFGTSVHEVPGAADAIREVDDLADEVLQLVGLRAQKVGV